MVEKGDMGINNIPVGGVMFPAQCVCPGLVRLSHFRSNDNWCVQCRKLSAGNKKAARSINQAAILFRDEKLKRRRQRLRKDRLLLQRQPWLQPALRGASHWLRLPQPRLRRQLLRLQPELR